MHTHDHVFLCTVLLPVLGMLILCGLLSCKIVGKVYFIVISIFNFSSSECKIFQLIKSV